MPPPSTSPEVMEAHFQKAAETYEKFAGALTRKISREILDKFLTKPLSQDSVVLDNAAGPGITATEILNFCSSDSVPRKIHATDFSSQMIKELEKSGHSEIKGDVMDMQDLKFDDGTFTHSFCCFGIFAAPDATKAAKEIYRTLQSGGSTYVTTWVHLKWGGLVNSALHRIRPDAPEYKGPLDPAWSRSEKLRDVLVSGGFKESQVQVVRLDAQADSSFWEGNLEFVRGPLVMGTLTKEWEEDEKKRFDEALVEVFDAELKTGAPVPMSCWIATATK